ncbi:MAG: bacteriohopanetetrol glucosamine biosynthesis glycosyltransferase HpnI [Alphaproteobacteria bacterium]
MFTISPLLSGLSDIGFADVALWIAVATSLASSAYVAFAVWRVGLFSDRSRGASAFLPRVTILKPVCGLDYQLYENLLTFCRQDYPVYQVIFGVRDPADPAIPVIRRIMAELPETDIALVVDGAVNGANLKVANLANMDREAKHPFLIISDSDMRVDPNYLASVVAPFADPSVGAVTCLYKATPAEGLASRLGAMFINEWFLPSVLVAAALQDMNFCLGATMAVRREALQRAGGFAALVPYLADDYMLGKLIADQGFAVRLSSYVLENVVSERSLAALVRHELRWARTIRTVQPVGYAFSFLTYAIPLAILAYVVRDLTASSVTLGLGPLVIAVVPRLMMHYVVQAKFQRGSPTRPWLVPVRDILSFFVWGASFFGRGISWRGNSFAVHVDGSIRSE